MPSPPVRGLFFHDARQLLTLAGPPVPRRGADMQELGILPDGALLTDGTKIARVGRTRELRSEAHHRKAEEINCRGRVVMPGFVDSHTHLVFAGNRVEEYEKRIGGKTYEEIAHEGGGIRVTSRAVRRATLQDLMAQASRFLKQFAACGTTTVEAKSGYGLDVQNEIKILSVVKQLRKLSPLDVVPTLLAGHALPSEYEGRRKAYIQLVTERLIPIVARRRLAEFIDCFCDRGAFTLEGSRTLLRAGARAGLIPRLHAEQLSRTGSCRLAIKLGAASVDHLDCISRPDIRALARSSLVATLLPGSNFHLGLGQYAPGRELIDAGAAVALATDFNPGTSPTLNMQFVISLACSAMRLTPAEGISAATINPAFALRRDNRIGSLEPGKQADLAVMDVDDYREIPYYFGWNHCVMTVKRGRIIYSRT